MYEQWMLKGGNHDEAGSAPSWRAQQTVALWWPWYTLISSPFDIDQSLAVVSEEAAKGKIIIWHKKMNILWLEIDPKMRETVQLKNEIKARQFYVFGRSPYSYLVTILS